MSFSCLAVFEPKSGDKFPSIKKFTFDNKIFYDLPANLISIKHHPLIESNSQFKNFSSSLSKNEVSKLNNNFK